MISSKSVASIRTTQRSSGITRATVAHRPSGAPTPRIIMRAPSEQPYESQGETRSLASRSLPPSFHLSLSSRMERRSSPSCSMPWSSATCVGEEREEEEGKSRMRMRRRKHAGGNARSGARREVWARGIGERYGREVLARAMGERCGREVWVAEARAEVVARTESVGEMRCG